MNKRSFLLFAIFFAAIAVAVPVWAIDREGDPESSAEAVAPADEEAKKLFAINCGSCHTLAAGGTSGVVGPNLDDLLGSGTPEGNEPRVQAAIDNGVQGRMPAGILQGEQSEEVAEFVARVSGS